ncbi:hypothetical protein HZA97_09685 [Candidatus Woesearchaeota archaeon]|nr:hypothetical protein [Candidatus Woesearchaeota archaeon]
MKKKNLTNLDTTFLDKINKISKVKDSRDIPVAVNTEFFKRYPDPKKQGVFRNLSLILNILSKAEYQLGINCTCLEKECIDKKIVGKTQFKEYWNFLSDKTYVVKKDKRRGVVISETGLSMNILLNYIFPKHDEKTFAVLHHANIDRVQKFDDKKSYSELKINHDVLPSPMVEGRQASTITADMWGSKMLSREAINELQEEQERYENNLKKIKEKHLIDELTTRTKV